MTRPTALLFEPAPRCNLVTLAGCGRSCATASAPLNDKALWQPRPRSKALKDLSLDTSRLMARTRRTDNRQRSTNRRSDRNPDSGTGLSL